MRRYGARCPYVVVVKARRVPFSFRTYSKVLFETRSEPSPLDTCSHSKNMPLRPHSPPVVVFGAAGPVAAPACVFRTHPRAATPRRCPQLRAAAALSPLLFAGVATYIAPLRESPPLS